MKNIFLVTIIILWVIIFKCRGFNKDYYEDESDINIESPLYNNMSRRSKLSGTNISNFADEMLYHKIKRKKEFRTKELSKSLKMSRFKINDTIFKQNDTTPCSEKDQKPLSLSNLLDDYDYVYSEDNEQRSLREKIVKVDTARNKILSDNNYSTEESKAPFALFYNLQPAIQQQICKINQTVGRNKSWYVLHDFPCWNLPLLYGQLIRHKHRNVFSLYGWKLDEVIDPGIDEKSNYKAGNPPVSHTVNKWCEVEPCFGDHTLCLFNNKKMSKICKKGYKVEVPTILEQIAIVNTINSMRNQVANGLSKRYSHLPPAANMRQVIYDYDLEKMSKIWLQQCIPGSAPCSALDDNLVSELECTKFAKYCCRQSSDQIRSNCIPRTECFLFAVTGCIHVWFWRAGKRLRPTDIQCGRASVLTFDTVQLLWAKTTKIGCAYGENFNGNIRVVCNFAPGAPFFLRTTLYCGIISYDNLRQYDIFKNLDIDEQTFLSLLGLKWNRVLDTKSLNSSHRITPLQQNFPKNSVGGVHILKNIYGNSWARKQLNAWKNGSYTWIARLVAKYRFIDKSEARCDSDETIYVIGKPGSKCVENGRTFPSLCFDFRDPTPGYRLVAVVATIVLFSLILYDLFSGVVRQTNY